MVRWSIFGYVFYRTAHFSRMAFCSQKNRLLCAVFCVFKQFYGCLESADWCSCFPPRAQPLKATYRQA